MQLPVVAVPQGAQAAPQPPQGGDQPRPGVPQGRVGVVRQVDGRPQLVVGAPLLPPLHAELRPVVDRRNPRQGVQQHVHRQQICGVAQLAGDAVHVVVVGEAVQLCPAGPVEAHVPQPLHRVGDLKIIAVVVAGIQRLVQRVVGDGVEHPAVDPPGIVPVDHLAHQPEIRLHLLRQPPQHLHKAKVQHVRRVQPQPVDVEVRHPAPDGIAKVALHLVVPLVQLHQKVVAAPVVVGKAVVIFIVSVKVHVAEPVPVGGLLPLFLQVPKGEKVPPYVVEYPVQNDPDALFVARRHQTTQIVVGAQPPVHGAVVGGVVAVAAGLEHRPQVQGIAPQGGHVIHPGQQGVQPVGRLAVVVPFRRPRQPQGIDMVKNGIVIPAHRRRLLRQESREKSPPHYTGIFPNGNRLPKKEIPPRPAARQMASFPTVGALQVAPAAR